MSRHDLSRLQDDMKRVATYGMASGATGFPQFVTTPAEVSDQFTPPIHPINLDDIEQFRDGSYKREPDYQINEGRGSGKRFNSGKAPMHLIPPFAIRDVAEVFGKGAEKYGERNWQKGMKWSNIIASLKRHLNAIERGEDFDDETGLLHVAHLGANVLMLGEYYHTFPQGDDRYVQLRFDRIVLDIDGVICDFESGIRDWATERGIHFETDFSSYWYLEPALDSLFQKEMHNPEFWLSMPAKVDGSNLTFQPAAYVTHRPIPGEVTKEWLHRHGFPNAPLYTVPGSKIETLKEIGTDVFVDDKWENFVEATQAGIFTYLMAAPYNKRYWKYVGHRVLHDLSNILSY